MADNDEPNRSLFVHRARKTLKLTIQQQSDLNKLPSIYPHSQAHLTMSPITKDTSKTPALAVTKTYLLKHPAPTKDKENSDTASITTDKNQYTLVKQKKLSDYPLANKVTKGSSKATVLETLTNRMTGGRGGNNGGRGTGGRGRGGGGIQPAPKSPATNQYEALTAHGDEEEMTIDEEIIENKLVPATEAATDSKKVIQTTITTEKEDMLVEDDFLLVLDDATDRDNEHQTDHHLKEPEKGDKNAEGRKKTTEPIDLEEPPTAEGLTNPTDSKDQNTNEVPEIKKFATTVNSVNVRVDPSRSKNHGENFEKIQFLKSVLQAIQYVDPHAWIKAYDESLNRPGIYKVDDVPTTEAETDAYLEDAHHNRKKQFYCRIQVVIDKEFTTLKKDKVFLQWCYNDRVYFTRSDLKTTRAVFVGFFSDPCVSEDKLPIFQERISNYINQEVDLPPYQITTAGRVYDGSSNSTAAYQVYSDQKDKEKLNAVFSSIKWQEGKEFYTSLDEFASLSKEQKHTIVKSLNSQQTTYSNMFFRGFTAANPTMRTIASGRTNMDWDDPNYDENCEECDDEDIPRPDHLKIPSSNTDDTIPLSQITIADYLMTFKDSLGYPLFVKAFAPSAGSIEVVFLSRRYREITKLSTLINGELARVMNSRSIELGFLDPIQATQDAINHTPWTPFQLASRVLPTQLPARNHRRNQNTLSQYNVTPQSQIRSIHDSSKAAATSHDETPVAKKEVTNPYQRVIANNSSSAYSPWSQSNGIRLITPSTPNRVTNSPEVRDLQKLVAGIQEQVNKSSKHIDQMNRNQQEYKVLMNDTIKSNQQELQQQIKDHATVITTQQNVFEAMNTAKLNDLTNQVTAQRQEIRNDVQNIVSASSASVDAKLEQLLGIMMHGGRADQSVRAESESMEIDQNHQQNHRRAANPSLEANIESRDGRASPAVSI
jgi:hypothetical protein